GYELSANWIWADAEVHKEQWVSMRKTFTLDEVPEEAFARISADTKYWLWINGEMAIFEGQLKLGDSRYTWYYDKEDISDYLVEGENTIAVQVYYSGKSSAGTVNSGVPAFLFEANIGNTLICSDTTWKAVLDPAYLDAGIEEHSILGESSIRYVAEKEMIDASGNRWTDKEFDDSAWAFAVNQDEKIRTNRIKDDSGNISPIYYQDTDPRTRLVLRSIPQWYIDDMHKYTADGANGTGTYTVSEKTFVPLALPGEYVLEAEVELPTANTAAAIGLCVCVKDKSNFYMPQIILKSGLTFKPHKMQGSWSSSSTNLNDTELSKSIYDTANGVDNRFNTKYTVKIEVAASTIKTYLNGTLLGTVTDANLAREGSTVGIRQAVGEPLNIYSFKVTDTSENEIYNANIDSYNSGDTIKEFNQLVAESSSEANASKTFSNTVFANSNGEKYVTIRNVRVGINDLNPSKAYTIVNETNQQGTPYLKVRSKTGGETITILSDVDSSNKPITHQYVTKAGEQSWEALGWVNGYVFTFTVPESVEVLELGFRPSGYNTSATGFVTTDNDILNQIYKEAYDTLYICMRDTYMDCPDRERMQYWGDSVSSMQRAAYAMDERAALLYTKLLKQALGFAEPNGVLSTHVARPGLCGELPTQSLAGVHSFWQHYMYFGGEELLFEAFPHLIKYLKVWDISPNGIIEHRTGTWNAWMDWGSHYDSTIIENCWYYVALDNVLKIAQLEGSGATDEDIEFLTSRMELISKNFDNLYWDESKNAYYYETDNGIADDRANALAVYVGLADKSHYDDILSVLTSVYNASPYIEKYVLEAMYLMGYADEAVARTIERYTPIANDGYPTLTEFWVQKPGGTNNHAWTGAPMSMLYMYNAGITPLSPEFKTFQVRPQLGTLTSVDAYMERGSGKIVVNAAKSATSFVLTVTVPSGADGAVISVPRIEGIDTMIKLGEVILYADGRAINALPSGVSYAGEDVDYVSFLVAPGEYTFTSSENISEESDTYSFVIDSALNGTISVNGTEITSFPYTYTGAKDSTVTVVITPDKNYRVTAITGTDPETVVSDEAITRTYTLDGNKTFNAEFEKALYADYKTVNISVLDKDMANYALNVYLNGESITLPFKCVYDNVTSLNLTLSTVSDYNYSVTINGNDVKSLDFEVVENTDIFVDLKEISTVDKLSIVGATVNQGRANSTTWHEKNLYDGIRVSTSGSFGYSSGKYSTDPDVSADPYEITLDLGTIQAINQIALFPRTNATAVDTALSCSYPSDFKILVSRDGMNYDTVLTVEDCPNPRFKQQCFDFDVVYARYVKLSVTELGLGPSDDNQGTRPRLQLAEFDVYYNAGIALKDNYGSIPDEYSDTEKYPFAVFGAEYGDFRGAFATWQKALEYVIGNNRIGGSASLGKTLTIVLRRDYDIQKTHTYSDGTTCSEASNEWILHNIGGTLVVDLMGCKMTRKDIPLLNVYSRKNEEKSYLTTIVFKNGEITTTGSQLMAFNHADTITEATGKKPYDITFENITFTSSASSPFLVQTWDNSNGYGTTVNMTFNNCIFDVAAASSAITFFKVDDNRVNSVDYNIVINGGAIINASINHTIAALGEGDSLRFGQYNGKYMTISLLTSLEVPTGTFMNKDGNELLFAKESVSGDYTTYALAMPIKTPYGNIPVEYYSSELYPLIVFQNGKFQGAYSVFASGSDENNCAMGKVKLLTASTPGLTAEILLRRDITVNKRLDNQGQILGDITIDLNGYTMTQTNTTLFTGTAKNYKGIDDSSFTIINGNIILKTHGLANMDAYGAKYGTDANSATGKYKTISFIFKNVNISLAKGATLTTLFGPYSDSTSITTEGCIVGYKYIFDSDCVIDVSNAPKGFTLFEANDNKISGSISSTAYATNCIVNVTVDGGKIIFGASEITLSEINEINSSSVEFTNENGSYTEFIFPRGAKTPTETLNGGTHELVKISETEDTVTYRPTYSSIAELEFKPKSSITLGSELVYNVYVPVNAIIRSFTLDGITYNDLAAITDIVTLDANNYYHFAIELPSAEAARDIVLTVIVDVDGKTYSGKWSMSTPKYAAKVLTIGTDIEKTLAKDVLAYVKAAYSYFTEFNTAEEIARVNALVESIIGDYKASPVSSGETNTVAPVTSVTLNLDARPSIRFYVTDTNLEFFANGKKLNTVTGTDETYGAYVELDVYAYALSETITYGNGGSYHISDFVKGSAGTAHEELVKAFVKYVESASDYRKSVIGQKCEPGKCIDAYSDHKCDICGERLSDCADNNNDHKCDVCGITLTDHTFDNNADTTCNDCGYERSIFEAGVYDNNGYSLNYRVYTPSDISAENKRPLILFLHGAGERGSDNEAQLRNAILKVAGKGEWANAIILAPQCPTGTQWVATPWANGNYQQGAVAETEVMNAVVNLVKSYAAEDYVDTARIYAVGVSMGGFGTWDIVSRYPELFAAAVAMCGGGPIDRIDVLKDIPIYTFHGNNDPTVPYEATEEMYNAIVAAGGDKILFHTFEGATHHIWNQSITFEGDGGSLPSLESWLFAQKKEI
ncbi:MAG: hypothetical protein E7673_06125, partial [Ruminococcaceae bacterium]|nr:hypothetical protein [Oscillospiraceae bacterium]